MVSARVNVRMCAQGERWGETEPRSENLAEGGGGVAL